MANNRMWLVHERTGAKVLLAKYYPSTGWYICNDNAVDAAFERADFGHLSELDREEMAARPFEHGFYSIGGNNGEAWRLEYDEEPLRPSTPENP